MSRAFNPPSSLSKDDRQTIGEVRRDIWVSGVKGMGIGGVTGITSYAIANRMKLFGSQQNPKNLAMASVLLGMTCGSFLGAVVTGKNEVHQLHPIYKVGAKTPKPKEGDVYRDNLERAWQRETDLKRLIRRRTTEEMMMKNNADGNLIVDDDQHHHHHDDIIDDDPTNRLERQRNRLVRRASLTQQMQQATNRHQTKQQQSQTVSHPHLEENHDVNDNADDNERLERQQNRIARRKSLERTMATPRDSHGGRWWSSSSS